MHITKMVDVFKCWLLKTGVGVLCVGALSATAQSEYKDFPVQLEGKTPVQAIAGADTDGDGKGEIYTFSAAGLLRIDPDGKVYKIGVMPGQENFQRVRAPVLCDLDADKKLEVAVVHGMDLLAVEADGTAINGYPTKLPEITKAPLSCYDNKLFTVTDDGQLLKIDKGVATRLHKLGKGAESGVSFADLNSDTKLDMAVVGGDAGLYLIPEGEKKQRVYKMNYRSSGSVAIGDIDDDGLPDFVVASQDFSIHAVNLKGEPLKGFPIKTKYRIYGSPALADLDGDGVLDILAGSGDKKLYAIKKGGKALPGFPVNLKSPIETDPIVADVDHDGIYEIAVVTKNGRLHVLNAKGKPRAGFPIMIGAGSPSPAFIDLDGDQRFELVAHGKFGTMHAYTFKKKGNIVADLGWPQVGHDVERSGRYWPNQGRYLEVGFNTEVYRTTDDLNVKYKFFDLDGDKEKGTKIRWYTNGKYRAEFDDKRSVPASKTAKNESWTYTLQNADNYEQFGDKGKLVQLFKSPKTMIQNTPPVAPMVRIGPDKPDTLAQLKAEITKASTDVDGDAIKYAYVWLKDNTVETSAAPDSPVLAAKKTKKKQRWQVFVVPSDGTDNGEAGTAETVILNTPPGAPQVAPAIAQPKVTDFVKIAIKKPAPDVDKDKISYRYYYQIDGKPVSIPPDASALPVGLAKKHQKVKIRVEAWDDDVVGGSSETEYTVLNTPPPAPSVALSPMKPQTADAISAAIADQTLDADGDPLSYRYVWKKNGKEVKEPWRILNDKTKKDDVWQFEVKAYDGEAESQAVSKQVKVVNTRPDSARVRFGRLNPYTNEALSVVVDEAARDNDDDTLQLRYRWFKNGKPVKELGTDKAEINASQTKKNELWEVEVAAFDGSVESKPVRLRTTIRNTPPTAPKVKLSKVQPTVKDASSIAIVAPSKDIDGDALKYRYRWLVNGRPQKSWPMTKAKLNPGDTKKGDFVEVAISAFDGEVEGESTSATLSVQNHLPSAPALAVAPLKATTEDTLSCTLKKPGLDPDKDRLSYDVQWYRNGKAFGFDPTQKEVVANVTREADSWHCTVRAFDGEGYSTVAKSEPVKILNAVPSSPNIQIFPTKAFTKSDLYCGVVESSQDPDNDVLAYEFRWTVNGKPVTKGLKQPDRVPHAMTQKGQRWKCEVFAKDEASRSAPVKHEVEILNTPPTRPRVEFSVAKIKPGEPLRCDIHTPSTDDDKDPIDYRFVWKRNGKVQSFASTSVEVPARLVRAGDAWTCEVTPTDGAESGMLARSKRLSVEGDRRLTNRRSRSRKLRDR